MTEKMHYFRAVEGHAARRMGSEAFIGCARGPKGYTWNVDVVVAITDTEMMPYRKDYSSYVRHGDLLRATEEEYKAWLAQRTAASELEGTKRAAKKAEDAVAAKPLTKAEKKAAKKAAQNANESDAPASDATSGNANPTQE